MSGRLWNLRLPESPGGAPVHTRPRPRRRLPVRESRRQRRLRPGTVIEDPTLIRAKTFAPHRSTAQPLHDIFDESALGKPELLALLSPARIKKQDLAFLVDA